MNGNDNDFEIIEDKPKEEYFTKIDDNGNIITNDPVYIETMKQNKNHEMKVKIITWLAWVVLFLIGSFGYYYFTKQDNNTANTNEETTENVTENKDGAIVIDKVQLNKKIIKMIAPRSYKLQSYASVDYFKIPNLFMSYVNSNFFLGTLTDDMKLAIALESINIDEFNGMDGCLYPDSQCTFSANYVDTIYKNLFGSTPTHKSLDGEDVKLTCYSFEYDKSNNTYTEYTGAGCGTPPYYLDFTTYINNIELNNNDIYVYLNAGFVHLSYIDEQDIEHYNLYKVIYSPEYQSQNSDNNFKITEESLIKDNYFSDNFNNIGTKIKNELKIDETNYQDFSEYKITFKNDNGNYYYQSIERTR